MYLHQEDNFRWETCQAFLEHARGGARLLSPPSPDLLDSRECHLSQQAGSPLLAGTPFTFKWRRFRANASERIWNYMRKYVTHNRFFERPQELCDELFGTFDYVRHYPPQEIEGLLRPFCSLDLPLFSLSDIISDGLPRTLDRLGRHWSQLMLYSLFCLPNE